MDSNQKFDPYSPIYNLRSRGVFFVSTTDGERAHFHFGCWTTQCSHQPPRMLTCFPKEYEGTEIMQKGGVFALSMVAADQEEFHDHFFSGDQTIDLIGADQFMYAETGSPILKNAVAYFDCKVVQTIDNGDFVLAIGDIVKGEVLHPEKKTLNVEYLSLERKTSFAKGPLVLPTVGFPLSKSK
jgi:flavin reductase (DIM6/NTAB) family NADH-FMN oxidoreductase RutF